MASVIGMLFQPCPMYSWHLVSSGDYANTRKWDKYNMYLAHGVGKWITIILFYVRRSDGLKN